MEVHVVVWEELLADARARILADVGPLDEDGEAAARFLADLYMVGLDHNVAPHDWAAVTSMPGASLDSILVLRRRERMADEMSRRAGLLHSAFPSGCQGSEAQLPNVMARPDRRGRGRGRGRAR